MNDLLTWLLMFVVIIFILFYLLYQAVKTKNIKYAYGIGAVVLLMIGMLFS